MKGFIVVASFLGAILCVAVFLTQRVHGQVTKANSGIKTAHKVGHNCTSNTWDNEGGCASCVDLAVSVPVSAQITAYHCLTNAGYPNDYPHYQMHEVRCGEDVSWSIFEPPSVNGNTVTTRYHNRSSDRDRDVELTVDYQP